jgi:SAM-dependent methyltransferase
MQSVSPLYFESLYQRQPDPWNYETNPYELQKYAETIAALPQPSYQSGLEIGGSIGVLTEKLAPYCQALLSLDVSPTAQSKARQRCLALPQVEFQIMQVPNQFPDRRFDLVVMSEVGYYLCEADLRTVKQQILNALIPGGHLLLLHWLEQASDFRLSGEQVHDCFLADQTNLNSLTDLRRPQYRLDILERL